MNSLPLSGILVLDLTRLTPGGFCSLMLADYGARVIKVEDPFGGDYIRDYLPHYHGMGSGHWILNRNKESIVIDLKKERGKKIFEDLCKKADVVLESYRPGIMGKLGFGYEAVQALNEKIIYCSITGFGHSGPYRDRVGYDLNYIALSRILDLTGREDGAPVVPTEAAGIGAFGAMLCALLRGKLNWPNLKQTFQMTVRINAMVCWIMISAGAFSKMVAVSGLGDWVCSSVGAFPVFRPFVYC